MLATRALSLRALGLLAIFAALQFGWQTCADSRRARSFIEHAVTRPAAFLANRITPNVHVHVDGNHLLAAGGGLNIVNGCDGIESLILLIAGFAIAPISWRTRITGALAGLPLIFLLNQARILALFYAYRTDAEWFDILHGFLAPILIVCCLSAYFYGWLVIAQHRTARRG